MEAIKYLAWHLFYACEDMDLHDKLLSISPSDRKQIVQLIKWCLQNGKRINTVLKQEHLNQITEILQNGSNEEVEEFHFHMTMDVFLLEMEKIQKELDYLQTNE